MQVENSSTSEGYQAVWRFVNQDGPNWVTLEVQFKIGDDMPMFPWPGISSPLIGLSFPHGTPLATQAAPAFARLTSSKCPTISCYSSSTISQPFVDSAKHPTLHVNMPTQATNSGIVTDASGERHIPESLRADGSVRKAIKVRPGYRPPEDVELYKNRTAETFRNRYKGGVIGADSADVNSAPNNSTTSAAANKNAKRREARKKAKAAESGQNEDNEKDGFAKEESAGQIQVDTTTTRAVDPEVEREKKARNLKKKLKQAKELKDKKEGGQALLPEQIAKVIKINELVRELAALGFDSEGEPVKKEDDGKEEAPA